MKYKSVSLLTTIFRCLFGVGTVVSAFFTLQSAALAQTTSTDLLPPGGIKLQIVSFGDSLSDVGTYSPFAEANFGGGRFTTNPGSIWTQLVAAHYGDVLTPAFVGGFGQPLTPAGGLGFGQGGSRVSMQPGIGHAAAGTPDSDFAARTTVPVTDQVNSYLETFATFNSNQLVLINGGANDLLFNLQTAQNDPTKLLRDLVAVNKAAVDLGDLVQRVIAAGATHIVVLNLADFGSSPVGLLTPDKGAAVRLVIKSFNNTLRGTLLVNGALKKVIYIDEFSFMDQVISNFQNLGFQVTNTGVACNSQAEVAIATKLGLSNPAQFSDSLFCSPQTLTAPDADQTFVFADLVHPTTHFSAIFAQYVEQQIAASGLGK